MAPFLTSFHTPQDGVAPFLKEAARNNGSCPSSQTTVALYPAARLMSDARAALRHKYGKYLPHQRTNVDQVKHKLTLDEYGEKDRWVLLEPAA